MLRDLLRTATLLSVVSLLLMTCGCGGIPSVIHNATLSGEPLLSDALDQAPPLQQAGYSRVVFYCPRLSGLDKALFGGMGFVDITLENPGSLLRVELMDQTGLYVDVPAGSYQVKVKSSGTVEMTFEPDQQYYFRTDSGVFSGEKIRQPESQEALQEIQEKKIRWCDGKFLQDDKTAKFAVIPKEDGKWVSSEPTHSVQNGRIYFFNTKSSIVGPLMKLRAGVDCLPTYSVGAKKYICFEVAPGRHVFAVHAENLGQNIVAPVGKEVSIAEGEEVFISFGLSKGVKLLASKDGEKLRKKYKIAKNGYYRLGPDSPR